LVTLIVTLLALKALLRAALRQIQLSIGGPKTKKKRHKGALKVLIIDITLKLHFINQDKHSTDIDRCFFLHFTLIQTFLSAPTLTATSLNSYKAA